MSRCQSDKLCRKLLEKAQILTLQNLQDTARNYEAVKRQTKSTSSSNDSVNRLSDDPANRNKKYDDRTGNSRGGHFFRDPHCPARGKTCSNYFRWDILQVYAKLGDSCDRSGVPYMHEVEVEDEFLMKKVDKEK